MPERRSRKMPEILMYHHVEPLPLEPPPVHGGSYVSPAELGRHLDALASRGYGTRTLARAARPEQSGDKAVVLTFDDACRCFAEHAAPALLERGMTATVFAVADQLGGTNTWDSGCGERTERLLDGPGLRRLADAGFEVGCHGASHRNLAEIDDEAVLAAETADARARLEDAVGRPVTTFCYPYGAVSEAARRAVREAGFVAAVGIVDHGVARPGDLWALPRWPVWPGTGSWELLAKAGGAYHLWRRLPRLGLSSAVRSLRRRLSRTPGALS